MNETMNETEDLTTPRDITLAAAAPGEFSYLGNRYVKVAAHREGWPRVVKVSNGVMLNADPTIEAESIPPDTVVQQAPWWPHHQPNIVS